MHHGPRDSDAGALDFRSSARTATAEAVNSAIVRARARRARLPSRDSRGRPFARRRPGRPAGGPGSRGAPKNWRPAPKNWRPAPIWRLILGARRSRRAQQNDGVALAPARAKTVFHIRVCGAKQLVPACTLSGSYSQPQRPSREPTTERAAGKARQSQPAKQPAK